MNIYFIVNVEAAIYRDNKWLIIKRGIEEEHAPGKLSLVGGKVEGNSNEKDVLENAVKREILEEVGINVYDHLHYVESNTFTTDDGKIVIDIVFLCKYKSGDVTVVDTGEVANFYWLSTEEILNDINSPIYVKNSIIKAGKLKKILGESNE